MTSWKARMPKKPWMYAVLSLTVALTAIAWLPACGVQAPPEHAKRTPKPGKADLPAVPELDPQRPPVKYPEDGAYSVSGLLTSD